MKIASIEAIPVRIPRDREKAVGSAGSPTALVAGEGNYRWSPIMPVLYPVQFETALVKITLSNGICGWGESQAPLAPEVACAIIDLLLTPILFGKEFEGNIEEIEALWTLMYSAMRVRGQTGGFMLDAIAGIDIALWDLAGKIQQKPVCALIPQSANRRYVKAYLSGVPGGVREAFERRKEGFDTFKLFFDIDAAPFLNVVVEMRSRLGPETAIAIDALWRLTTETAPEFGAALDAQRALWLDAPLAPEDAIAHGELARAIRTPLALGESYRTRYELAPFFRQKAMQFVQPDLGRCGITETLRIARIAVAENVAVVPHISIAMGPQIAAAIHVAAALQNCELLEYNPNVFSIANLYLETPLQCRDARYLVPGAPGLGCDIII